MPEPKEAMQINLDSGIAYNSTIELSKFLPESNSGVLTEAAAVACALKSGKIHIFLIDPVESFHK